MAGWGCALEVLTLSEGKPKSGRGCWGWAMAGLSSCPAGHTSPSSLLQVPLAPNTCPPTWGPHCLSHLQPCHQLARITAARRRPSSGLAATRPHTLGPRSAERPRSPMRKRHTSRHPPAAEPAVLNKIGGPLAEDQRDPPKPLTASCQPHSRLLVYSKRIFSNQLPLGRLIFFCFFKLKPSQNRGSPFLGATVYREPTGLHVFRTKSTKAARLVWLSG